MLLLCQLQIGLNQDIVEIVQTHASSSKYVDASLVDVKVQLSEKVSALAELKWEEQEFKHNRLVREWTELEVWRKTIQISDVDFSIMCRWSLYIFMRMKSEDSTAQT